MMDFTKIKKLFIGGMELKQLFIAVLKNWARYSTESDGTTLYNGIGYKSGYRVRSGGAEGAYSDSSCTGYIPVSPGDVIRVSGCQWGNTDGSAFNVYNSSLSHMGQACGDGSNYGHFGSTWIEYSGDSVVQKADYYEWVVPPTAPDIGSVRFIRVTGAVSDGSKLIVYVNDDKADTQIWKSGYKNWVKYSTEADGATIYNGGLGYKDNCRVRSGGEEAANIAGSCSGYIPVNGGDIIRVATTGTGTGDRFTDGGASSAINVFGASSGKPGDNLGQVVGNSNGYGIFASDAAYGAYNSKSVIQKDSYWQWTVPPADSGIAFIRVSGYTNPDRDSTFEELIVTINEEIA